MRTNGPEIVGNGITIYNEDAGWFHLLTAPADYADEAAFFLRVLRERVAGALRTLLELGAGGGNTASHLKAHLHLTLTDLSPAMLALSGSLNPECEHLVGDMRSMRLGRQFDAVLIHDAIMYMATAADLRAALETAFVHCRPGGVAVFVPDCVRETFEAKTKHGGHDGTERALRYLEWTCDPDPADTSYITDFAILFRQGVDKVRVQHERHVMGLFGCADWMRLIGEVGFEAEEVRDGYGRVVFLGKRAASGT
jgi:SAM-dependent methyltransferase